MRQDDMLSRKWSWNGFVLKNSAVYQLCGRALHTSKRMLNRQILAVEIIPITIDF
jgi:hypothetical protein